MAGVAACGRTRHSSMRMVGCHDAAGINHPGRRAGQTRTERALDNLTGADEPAPQRGPKPHAA